MDGSFLQIHTYLPLFAVPRDTSKFRSSSASGLQIQRLLLGFNNQAGNVIVDLFELLEYNFLSSRKLCLASLMIRIVFWILIDPVDTCC